MPIFLTVRKTPISENSYLIFDLFHRFCATRWIEDEDVVARAIAVWDNVVKVMSYWESLSKSKRPKCKSYDVLAAAYKDKLMVAKFTFFNNIAAALKCYLVAFQSDKPMVPFLSNVLEGMTRKIMNLFIRKEVMIEANTPHKLIKIDVEEVQNRLPVDMVNPGTAVKAILRSKEITDGAKHQFRKDCVAFLTNLILKLQERSPLKYLIVRCSSSLSPVNMVQNQQKATSQFASLVEKLHQVDHVLPSVADSAKEEFEKFLSSLDAPTKEEFLQFDFSKSRVDEFLRPYFKDQKALWAICKVIFTLSHSQSAVERGFSINKELLIENLQEKSIVSQRVVYDHLQSFSVDLHEYQMSNGLLKSCKAARQRYGTHLEDQKRKVNDDKKSNKRKLITDEINNVKDHKKRLISSIDALNTDIEKLCYKAEESENMDFLVKANAFRRKVTEKKANIAELDKAIDKLTKDLQKEK